MKFFFAIIFLVSFLGSAFGADDVKIIRMHGQTYKIWTDEKGVRRIDPVSLRAKTRTESEKKVVTPSVTTEPKGDDVKAPQRVETDIGTSLVVDMAYDDCRKSLITAEGLASFYNVVFDYPKGKKFTVLMVVDNKTVQSKCEYGTRVTTTWEN